MSSISSIGAAQIDAAVALQASMPAWRDTNQLFAVLREQFPDFDLLPRGAGSGELDSHAKKALWKRGHGVIM